jgi:hypothetical protein
LRKLDGLSDAWLAVTGGPQVAASSVAASYSCVRAWVEAKTIGEQWTGYLTHDRTEAKGIDER